MNATTPPFVSRGKALTLAAVGVALVAVSIAVGFLVYKNRRESQYETADTNLKARIRIHYKLADLFNSVNEADDFKRIVGDVEQLVDRLKILAEEFAMFPDDVRAAASAANAEELERAKRAEIVAKGSYSHHPHRPRPPIRPKAKSPIEGENGN